jgi:hypothetical protein
MNKQWIYRNGEMPFSVTKIVMPNGEIFLTSVRKDGYLFNHNPTGGLRHYSVNNSYDLIPYEPYADFKIDDEVYSRDSVHDDWARGHFAGLVNGKPTVFVFGKSLFTSMCINVTVNFCKKANKEVKS